MGESTSISWTHHTFNPWWGCVKVSPGCTNCYAETFSRRAGQHVWGKDAPRRFFGDKHWNEPLEWNRAAKAAGEWRRVFCASMADWLEIRPDLIEPRARLLELVYRTRDLNWLLLTKRPECFVQAMRQVVESSKNAEGAAIAERWLLKVPPDNAWVGVTTENQEMADKRIPALLKIAAKIRFLSVEPMLGPVNIMQPLLKHKFKWCEGVTMDHASMSRRIADMPWLQWVICGGESGGQRREFQIEWAEFLAAQCTGSIAFHMKQEAAFKSGEQGRIPDALWARKEFPRIETPELVLA